MRDRSRSTIGRSPSGQPQQIRSSRRKKSSVAWALPVLLLLQLLPSDLLGTSILRRSLTDLVAKSRQVVIATVISVSYREDDRFALSWTDYTVAVLDRFKGEGPDTLTLSFSGGTSTSRGMVVLGVPTLSVGNTYVLFLSPGDRLACPLEGWSQGGFRVESPRPQDPTQERLVSLEGEMLIVTGDGSIGRRRSETGPWREAQTTDLQYRNAATRAGEPVLTTGNQSVQLRVKADAESARIPDTSRPASLLDLRRFLDGAGSEERLEERERGRQHEK